MVNKITAEDLINKGVIGLPDVPGLTTIEMQKKFDEISRDVIIPRFNELIDNTVSASDEFSKLNTYNVGDYCIYQGVLYKCTTAITTAGEWDATKWKATSIDKELKEISSYTENKDVISDKYDSSKTYSVGDYCIYDDTLYKCKTQITSAEEFDSSKWEPTNCGKEFEVLNSNLNVRYNEDSDTIQVLYGGKWMDCMSANMNNLILFDNEDKTDITGGWQITPSTAQSTTSTASVNTSINVGGLASNNAVDSNNLVLMTKKKLDVSRYTKIRVIVEAVTSWANKANMVLAYNSSSNTGTAGNTYYPSLNLVNGENELTFDLPYDSVYFGFIFRGGDNGVSGTVCTTSIKITKIELIK